MRTGVIQETILPSLQYLPVTKPKPIENHNKVPPTLIDYSSINQSDSTSNKNPFRKSQISRDKVTPKRSSSSLLIPVKDQLTANVDLMTTAPTRPQTVMIKTSSFNQKSLSSTSLVSNEDYKKLLSNCSNETSQKNIQPYLFTKSSNSQSFITASIVCFMIGSYDYIIRNTALWDRILG